MRKSNFAHFNTCIRTSIHNSKIFLYLFLLLLLQFPINLSAKTRISRKLTPDNNNTIQYRADNLENKMRVYLENKVSHRRHRSNVALSPLEDQPDDFDLLLLARTWNSLSPAFKKLYTQAVQIPDSYEMFISAGGHFEIYYTTTGIDSVSPEDFYMFDPLNWRQKISQPNGIPDYVDETAWALDSTWSMEIDRFKFNAPYPYKSSKHSSDRYKVLIAEPQYSDEYGFTLPIERVENNGFSSYITIRNDWSTFSMEPFHYDTNPFAAVRVTCAHEFFHAIQYAMSWNIGDNTQLDNFPLSWIEGSAVSMEELAFPEVNDYIQYAKQYFSYPQMSFFSSSDNFTYSNVLFFIYNSSHVSGSPVEFIRQMHLRNFQSPAQFIVNVEKTSLATGTPWPQQLNDFHTASYFSGTRADSTLFISDASQFSQWSYTQNGPSSQSISKNSIGIFSLTRTSDQSDTLSVFLGQQASKDSTHPNTWAATSILRFDDSTAIIPIQLGSTGYGSLTIPQWNKASELIVVTTSGFSDKDRFYDVDFVPCPITYTAGSSDTIYFDNTPSDKPFVTITALEDLQCPLTIMDTSNAAMLDTAEQMGLTPIDRIFSIRYPISWNSSSKVSLVTLGSTHDSLHFCVWNPEQKTWVTLSVYSKSDSTRLISTIANPGVYGFFVPTKTKASDAAIVVFPNPVRIQNGTKSVFYEGYGILEALVYSVNGTLVYKGLHLATLQPSKKDLTRYQWDLQSTRGHPLMPGIYTIVIKYSENSETKVVRKKLLLVP